MKSPKQTLLIELLIVFLLSPLLLVWIPFTQLTLNGGMLLLGLYALWQIRNKRFSREQLGIPSPFWKYATPWMLFTTLAILAVVLLSQFFPNGLFTGVSNSRSQILLLIPLYVLIGAPLQELIYRSYLFARLEPHFSQTKIALISMSVFAWGHLPYIIRLNSGLFYFSILGGVAWSLLYRRYPSFLFVSLSHGLVGAALLLLLRTYN